MKRADKILWDHVLECFSRGITPNEAILAALFLPIFNVNCVDEFKKVQNKTSELSRYQRELVTFKYGLYHAPIEVLPEPKETESSSADAARAEN